MARPTLDLSFGGIFGLDISSHGNVLGSIFGAYGSWSCFCSFFSGVKDSPDSFLLTCCSSVSRRQAR
jgi:hypothetical protein